MNEELILEVIGILETLEPKAQEIKTEAINANNPLRFPLGRFILAIAELQSAFYVRSIYDG